MAPISVILPVRNGMPFLPATIDSLLNQSMKTFEIIVVDDGSTDSTSVYLSTLVDHRIRIHRTAGIGLANALNLGIEKSSSKLLARLDADDLCDETRLELQYNYMLRNPSVVVCGTQARTINEHNQLLGQRTFPCNDSAIRWRLAFECPFLHPTVMMRRDSILAAGCYQQDEFPTEDVGLWCRLASQGTMANLDSQCLSYREHSASVTNNRKDEQLRMCRQHASNYASSLNSDIDKQVFGVLFESIWHYRIASHIDIRSLFDQYQILRNAFRSRYKNTELENEINRIDNKLRGMAMLAARREFPNPFKMSKYLAARATL